jgi:predicted secreted protein
VKRIVVLITAVLALTAMTTACGGDSSDDGSATSTTGMKTLAFRDAALPIAVVPGQDFDISLESTEGTGYEWTITGGPDPELVTVVDPAGTVKTGDDSDGAVGTTGATVFGFKAKASGTTEITFTYARASDPADNPTSTTFTINVS